MSDSKKKAIEKEKNIESKLKANHKSDIQQKKQAQENKTADHPAQEVFKFPCSFTFKIFGKNNPEFTEAVEKIFEEKWGGRSEIDWQQRLSKDETYLSLSITVTAESREQLDNTYQVLTDHSNVLMSM